MTNRFVRPPNLFGQGKRLEIKPFFSIKNMASLYHGDCLDFLKTIPDSSIQLIITSPPYNIGKEYESKLDVQDYVSQQRQVINECEVAPISWTGG